MVNTSNRNLWVDYLRSAITVLVVAHHSALAYTTFATFDKTAYINSTHAIVDTHRWIGIDIFVNYNDIFFMPLMFLIGGLFLSKSMAKKGAMGFTFDRISRLFLPFLFLGTLLMLLAYFPSHYIAHQSTDIAAYIKDFFTTQKWPVGPPWFIWVLFVFNILFVFLNPIIQKLKPNIVVFSSRFQDKPLLFWGFLMVFTWFLYVPVAYNVGAGTWTGWGSFDFQLSRILLYFGYFILGVVIGNMDFNKTVFSINASVVSHWRLWILISSLVFIILTLMVTFEPLSQLVKANQLKEFTAWMIYYTIYVASSTLTCMAFMTTFRKHIQNEKTWWRSLSDNAYLIYLVHFVFITWL